MNLRDAEWSVARRVGAVSEFAVLAPIKTGRIPGQRVTYEERLRFAISAIQGRASQDMPTGLRKISTLHFGKLCILRPEQMRFDPHPGNGHALGADVDPYITEIAPGPTVQVPPQPDEDRDRSFLLTMVTFDGDIKVYFRDIAEFVADDFDRIYRNCEEYPGTRDFERFWLWIRKYQIGLDLFYAANPDLTLPRIRYLEWFKAQFDAFAASVRSPNGECPHNIDELFDAFLARTQQLPTGFPNPSGIFQDKE